MTASARGEGGSGGKQERERLTTFRCEEFHAFLLRKSVRPHLDEPPLGDRVVLLRELETALDPIEFGLGQFVRFRP